MKKKLFEVHFIDTNGDTRKVYFYTRNPLRALEIFYKEEENLNNCVVKVVRKAITYGEEGGLK